MVSMKNGENKWENWRNKMKSVNNVNEAMEWFLENHQGSVLCLKGDEELIADSFPEAKTFYEG